MTEIKKTRTPRTLESITKGALELPLAERAALRDSLAKSVQDEVAALKLQAEQAAKLVG
jgi:hypothetical protein